MFSGGIYYALGALLLGCVLVYAMIRNARRNKANDAITDAATRMEYQDPERYAHGGREALERQLKK